MINKSKSLRILSLGFVAAGFALLGADAAPTFGQTRDPFDKPGWARPKTAAPVKSSGSPGQKSAAAPAVKAGPPPVVVVGAPDINQRIGYYKQLRLQAAENGQEIPKVTSVLTLDEMSIIGVFRTPRGYAAMVEAKPISLSYTIYPGEKFFDGQLVAIEENRLVFRKVTKMSNGKFIASVENKALRQYTDQEQIRGTAPIDNSGGEKKTETAANVLPPAEPKAETKNVQTIAPAVIISPLDEMNRQPAETPKEAEKNKSAKKKGAEKGKNVKAKTAAEKSAETTDTEKEKTAKKGKKPVKIAKNK